MIDGREVIKEIIEKKQRENSQMIQYDFDAHRIFMKPDTETTAEKIERDTLMAQFKFECEKELIRIRAYYEEKLNNK